MDFNQTFISEYADVFKALSHPIRLCIVTGLYDHPEGMNVSSIQGCIHISQSSVSQHLRILKQYDILDSERHGTEIKYLLSNTSVKRIVELLREFE